MDSKNTSNIPKRFKNSISEAPRSRFSKHTEKSHLKPWLGYRVLPKMVNLINGNFAETERQMLLYKYFSQIKSKIIFWNLLEIPHLQVCDILHSSALRSRLNPPYRNRLSKENSIHLRKFYNKYSVRNNSMFGSWRSTWRKNNAIDFSLFQAYQKMLQIKEALKSEWKIGHSVKSNGFRDMTPG